MPAITRFHVLHHDVDHRFESGINIGLGHFCSTGDGGDEVSFVHRIFAPLGSRSTWKGSP